MHYREIKPEPALRHYIDFFWTLEKMDETLPWEGIKLLPDGHVELTVNLGDPVVQRQDGKTETRPQAFIGGMYRSAFFIEPRGNLKMAGVAFLPGKLQHFIKFPFASLCGCNVDMEDIFGQRWKPVFDKIQEQKSLEDVTRILQQYLLAVLNPDQGLYAPIDQALSLMYKSAGNTPVQQFSKQLYIGERNFRRLFKEATGMSPKQFSRILRIKNVVTVFESGRVANITDLGYYCGYFDQAHFIHDFQLIAGESPGKYFSNRRAGEIRF